jgi:glycosyltransferase involved in cell wall biosynthesis
MSLLLDHYQSFDRRLTGTATAATDGIQLAARGETETPAVDIVIPVYNEVHSLAASVTRLHSYLSSTLPGSFRITIADNASTDGTPTVMRYLHRHLDHVAGYRLTVKGRGRALRSTWTGSGAPILAYLDVDLSTDLDAVLPLLAPLVSGHSDLAIGSRLAHGARIVRGPKRELISRGYNAILSMALRVKFSDAQCGFKAITRDAARLLLPLIEDDGWFFDTELLVLAERSGLRIHEVPVDWIDDPDSRVDIFATAKKDLQGIRRLRRSLSSGQLPLDDIASRLGRRPLVRGR